MYSSLRIRPSFVLRSTHISVRIRESEELSMPNYNQAPVLYFDKPKDKGTNYYELPQVLTDIIFKKLGNSSAQIRLMIVLIGTKPGFALSEKWILDRTGLTSSSYSNARTALIKRGWITLVPAESITVNFTNILKEEENSSITTIEQQVTTKNSSNTTLESCSNTIIEHCPITTIEPSSNTTIGIIDKEIDKEQNKGIDGRKFSKLDPPSPWDEPIVITREEAVRMGCNSDNTIWLDNKDKSFLYQGEYYKMV